MGQQFELTWELVFQFMSWTYSLAWCLSFYGQICQNFKLKNVQGMNLNFAAINLNGFVFYALFNAYGFFINDSQTGRVQLADLFFSLHALAATLYTGLQAVMYPRGENKLSKEILTLISLQWIILIGYYLLVRGEVIEEVQKVGVISLAGYFKLMCSLFKYIPQLLWNRKRKSTIGWSIFNVLMDLTGGIFSVLQTILEQIFLKGFKINITKLLLGSLTIVYDLLFVYQHYILYPSVIKNQNFRKIDVIDSPSSTDIANQNQMT